MTTLARVSRGLPTLGMPKGALPRAQRLQARPPNPREARADGLSAQQREAVAKILAWYRTDEQVFRLFGYAGTGKTTIARQIVDELGAKAVFAAFTGKAAYVLRTKGCANASTIHSLIYLPKEAVREQMDKLRAELAKQADPTARAALEEQIRAEQERLDSPDWVLREHDESALAEAELLVIDEVSMVGEDLAVDLLSYGKKVLVLGDPAQLPPVDGTGYFIDAEPDHLLTEIHRSAWDSPVTRLATAVRNCESGDRSYGITGMDGDSGRTDGLSTEELRGFDQVLVGTNAARWEAIRLLRSLAGFTEPAPMSGDRIICLANSGEADVFNGQQFTVRTREPAGRRGDQWKLSVTGENDKVRDLIVWAAGFHSPDGEREAKRKGRGLVAAATFAQAITTHKAQGSQWNCVLVIDASRTFYNTEYRQRVHQLGRGKAAALAHLNAKRWLYTAITRAAKCVVVVSQLEPARISR